MSELLGSSMRPTKPRNGCSQQPDATARLLWYCQQHKEFHAPDGEEKEEPVLGTLAWAKAHLSPEVTVAIAKLRAGVAAALDEYIDEAIHQGDTDNLLGLKDVLTDFGIYLQAAADIAEWAKEE
jgi:hypothetical protein